MPSDNPPGPDPWGLPTKVEQAIDALAGQGCDATALRTLCHTLPPFDHTVETELARFSDVAEDAEALATLLDGFYKTYQGFGLAYAEAPQLIDLPKRLREAATLIRASRQQTKTAHGQLAEFHSRILVISYVTWASGTANDRLVADLLSALQAPPVTADAVKAFRTRHKQLVTDVAKRVWARRR